MQHTDVSTLVRQSLLAMGCDPALIGELALHDDIVLDFHSLPSIHLQVDGNDVRMWSSLGERHDYQQLIEQHAAPMLMALTEQQPYASGGCLGVAINDETLQLTALLHPDYLAGPAQFGEALQAFFARVTAFSQMVSA